MVIRNFFLQQRLEDLAPVTSSLVARAFGGLKLHSINRRWISERFSRLLGTYLEKCGDPFAFPRLLTMPCFR